LEASAVAKKKRAPIDAVIPTGDYDGLLGEVVSLLETARRTSARAVNALMTATYWEIGRRIVDVEQGGEGRAEYGKALIRRMAGDLTERFGRGFGPVNVANMRRFHLLWPPERIFQTLSEKSLQPNFQIQQTPSVESVGAKKTQMASAQLVVTTRLDILSLIDLAACFPLPWSHYVKLLALKDETARRFYEQEALRGGWSVRQLDRQIGSQFYERTLLSRNKTAMLRKGAEPQPRDYISPEDEIKDPFVLEFLNLKDEYSEHDLEEALIQKLEDFLLELGGDFAFMGRQKRLRIGDEWYRIDLLFFHRRLRSLVVIDLKVGKFTHADAGQMHLYLNYAREHWTCEGENPPVGLILCAQKDEAVAHYSLENLPNKVMASEYRLALPDEKLLEDEVMKTQRALAGFGIAVEPQPSAGSKQKPRRPRTKERS
jgi:predicted nuclease of restriction endonuclease-like (RecB) superfamily